MAIMALHAAASGMRALDEKLNVIANNLANINTNGFKRSRVNFEDLLYQTKREPGVLNTDDEPVPHGIQVGTGVRVAGTQPNFARGAIDPTDRPLDWQIEGEGFFQVRTIFDGSEIIAYTRAGNFAQNAVGNVVLGSSDGPILEPPISIPVDALQISVASDGEILVRQEGSNVQTPIGQVELARFVNPEGLAAIGRNLWRETDASGTPVTGTPQSSGIGAVRGGALEMSNVDPVRELIDLIQTQRSFELNSQTIQAADESLQVVSNLRRF